MAHLAGKFVDAANTVHEQRSTAFFDFGQPRSVIGIATRGCGEVAIEL
ncbi:MAG: hypothetical protein O2820_07555 [Planctomycetota bacterium]|nr:hypothetical protein [Planctomycetota bacterium]MDA1249067.1 hypothetical protein [Planctomycetota bacterium]